ncbi:hypothetical protein PV327_009041 [Microctonus hyperodae]|uniref:Trichohyalin-plectin-homology domain-containing protein n=1 Tax=Microctonus hyperodae TaxID=165561 RepID=A0AA39FTN0_MICHY|nr:hypothetical protein PV327_009041 [Microctonus hyperodae]
MYSKQSTELKKISKRPSTLIISKNEFDRITDLRTEKEKLLDIAEMKTKKLLELKKLSYETTKDWKNSIRTINKRHRDELLSRRKKDNEAKIKLMKEITERNALERAKIVEEARKLILYRKPQCRLINRALLASECYRELNAQLEFKKKLKTLEENEDKKYVEDLKEKTEFYLNQEREKFNERLKKKKNYGMELKNQIEKSNLQLRKEKKEEFNADREDLNNMIKELQLIEECEANQVKKQKEEAKQNYLDAMEEKKENEAKLKHDEEMINNWISAYSKAKNDLNKMTKKKWKQSQADKIRRTEMIAEKCAVIWKSNDDEAEERLKKAQEDMKNIELDKLKSKLKMKEKMRADMEKYQQELAAIKEKRQEEEKNSMIWEALQRHKRDEYNKELKLEELKRDRMNKMELANDLRKQMAEDEARRKQDLIMNDDSAIIKAALDRTDEKVMNYCQEVLEESKGVRPLFPIIKAIETFKKERGLIPPIVHEEIDSSEDEKPRRISSKSISPKNSYQFG